MTKRIALYWHNGRGLGHTVRNATLGQALMDHMPGSAVIGITGASRGLDLLPPSMDFVKIPSYLAYEEQSGVRTTPVLPITKSEFQHMRENLIATFVRDFSPEVLIVDYHPAGKKGELVPAVTSSPNTQKVLGLRGILNTAAEANNEFFNPRMVAFIQEHFSAIHVYIDPDVFRLEEYYQIPASISKLLKYTGYVARPTVKTRAEARALLNIDADARIIVISFGGGQRTEMLWQSMVSGLSNLRNHFDFAYLAAGPYLEADAYERLRLRVSELGRDKHVILERSEGSGPYKWTRLLDPLPLWMKASDLFIGSGGYNSLAEVIATGANALIIPRHLSDREQELHSTRLANLGVLRVASLQTIMSEDITKLLEACLLEPYPKKQQVQIDTHGAQESARLIEMLTR